MRGRAATGDAPTAHNAARHQPFHISTRARLIWSAAGPALLMTVFGWLVTALPAVVLPYFPTQDGPAHLNTTLVWSALSSGGNGLFARYFELQPVPLTNRLATWLIAAAARVVQAPFAGNAAWITVFGVFVATVTVNLAIIGQRAIAFAPLFLAVVVGFLTSMGFMNFVIALAPFAQTVFLVNRGSRRAPARWVLAVLVCSAVTYIAHPLAGLGLAAALGPFAVGYLALGAVAAWPRARRLVRVEGTFYWRVPLACGLACLLLFLLALHDARQQMETYLLLAEHALTPAPAEGMPASGPMSRLLKLLSFAYLVSFSALDFVFAAMFGLVVTVLGWRRIRAFHTDRRLRLADSWLAAMVTLVALIVVAPRRIEYFLPDRLAACLLLVVILWLATHWLDRLTFRRLLVAGIVLNIGMLLWRLDRAAAIDTTLAEYASVGAVLPEGATVIALSSKGAAGCSTVVVSPLPCRFQPTAHFIGRVIAGRQIAWLSNYQLASTAGYFPVALRESWADLDPMISAGLASLRWDTPQSAAATNRLVEGLADLLRRKPVDAIVVWDDAVAQGNPASPLLAGIAPALTLYRETFVSKPLGAARVYLRRSLLQVDRDTPNDKLVIDPRGAW